MIHWRWPQYVMAAIYLIEFGMHLAKNGEPQEGNYSIVSVLVGTIINFAILKDGGFY